MPTYKLHQSYRKSQDFLDYRHIHGETTISQLISGKLPFDCQKPWISPVTYLSGICHSKVRTAAKDLWQTINCNKAFLHTGVKRYVESARSNYRRSTQIDVPKSQKSTLFLPCRMQESPEKDMADLEGIRCTNPRRPISTGTGWSRNMTWT
jgi:hypothetical protein